MLESQGDIPAAPAAQPPPLYRTAQVSMVPARIARGRWAETGLIFGGVALLGALAVYGLQTRAPVATNSKASKAAADHPPELIAESARATLPAAVAASVDVTVQIDVEGNVRDAKIAAPTPALAELEPRALAAARVYRFKPAVAAGVPSTASLTLPVRFAPMPNVRRVAVRGSETIGSSLGQAWAHGLEAQHPELHVEVEGLGSSTGFAALFDGSADLAASSRAIRPEEQALAQKLGITLQHAVAGHDGIAVIVHPTNPTHHLDLKSLANIFAGHTTRWSELGASDAPIRILGRPSYSGTHGFFREKVLTKLGSGSEFGRDINAVESSQVLVGRVAIDPSGIGYVSLSQVIPSVQVLSLSTLPDAPGIAATPDTVRDGSYPISRPLMLYWRAGVSRDALSFVEFAVSPAGQKLVEQAGFVSLAASEKNPDLAASQAAMGAEKPGEPVSANVAAHTPETVRVYFEQSRATLTPEAHTQLGALAVALRQGKRAVVVGNSDSVGQAAANRAFARRRAEAVAAQLRALHVAGAHLSVSVANSDHPLATNDTPEGRRENRRVDILLFDR